MSGGTILRKGDPIGFKQLFDNESCTYTYLLWDSATKDVILVDPVDTEVDWDLQEASDLGLNLVYGVNTHAHADRITGTYLLKQKLPGFRSVISKTSGAAADLHIQPGDRIVFGRRFLEARATPGHADGCMSYVADDQSFVLTGDALLMPCSFKAAGGPTSRGQMRQPSTTPCTRSSSPSPQRRSSIRHTTTWDVTAARLEARERPIPGWGRIRRKKSLLKS